jgi:hypothetical protein
MKQGYLNMLIPTAGMFCRDDELWDGLGNHIEPAGVDGKIHIYSIEKEALKGRKRRLKSYRKVHPDTTAITFGVEYEEV